MRYARAGSRAVPRPPGPEDQCGADARCRSDLAESHQPVWVDVPKVLEGNREFCCRCPQSRGGNEIAVTGNEFPRWMGRCDLPRSGRSLHGRRRLRPGPSWINVCGSEGGDGIDRARRHADHSPRHQREQELPPVLLLARLRASSSSAALSTSQSPNATSPTTWMGIRRSTSADSAGATFHCPSVLSRATSRSRGKGRVARGLHLGRRRARTWGHREPGAAAGQEDVRSPTRRDRGLLRW